MNHFKFLKSIYVLYVLVTVTCTGSLLSHDTECSALFQFKQTIIHQDDVACATHGSQVLYSWNTSFDCCSWEGVTCSNDHDYGHVIGLDLSERSLCGHLNSSSTLFDLVHLQRLNLSSNDFGESQIPYEIGRLKQLRTLDLSYCGFNGQIPNEISQLIRLSSLNLSGNPLKLHSLSFKNLVQNFTGLEELHLSGVDISSSVPHFLTNFSSLRSIRLRGCLLWSEFPAAIFKLPKLQVLDLALNPDLTGSFPEFYNHSLLEEVILSKTGFFGIIPESISHLKHLTVLFLSRCSFSGHIPRSVSNMTQLIFLGLGNNKFTGFVPSLVSLSKLDVLELSGTQFEKGLPPSWLEKLSELSELYLFDMNINGEIPLFLANLTKLRLVDMSKNSLIGPIPSWLFNHTQLTHLEFELNQLQGPIPNTFSNFKDLEFLNLGSNNFSGRVELDMFLRLNKLQGLRFGYNMISLVATNNYTNTTLPEFYMLALSHCNLKEFPAFLRFQNKLNVLHLDDNNIHGLVPVWIWNNSRETLELINLSDNFITGFDQHPQFQELNLSFNNMSGTLPACLGVLSNSLTALILRHNNFHGKMMNAFMPGSMLEYLDLSENRFMGPMPRSLSNCTNLQILSLQDNSFIDIFPFWLGSLANLQVLVLRSNKFYGPIQGSTIVSSQFPELRIIDLSNNCFSGQLDQNYFQTWNAMKSDKLGVSSVMETYISTQNPLKVVFKQNSVNVKNIY